MAEEKKAEKKTKTGAEEEAVLTPDPSKEGDTIRIASDVIAMITGIVSSDVEGIAGMSGGIVDGIAEKLGRRDLTKGIKVKVDEDKVTIDLNVIAEYGKSIVESTSSLKNNIRGSVEKTTGLKVVSININVLGLEVPGQEETKQEDEE